MQFHRGGGLGVISVDGNVDIEPSVISRNQTDAWEMVQVDIW
jgi:hypothetical protein